MKKFNNTIYQTWHTPDINDIIKEKINKMKELNPSYEYKFFNDNDMDIFVSENFNGDIIECYNKLNIRAAKADFWRYLILYQCGGIYIDMDCMITQSLDSLITNDNDAILSIETVGICDGPDKNYYINWAMIFAKGHPILKKTIEFLITNVKNNSYPNDIFNTTGPAVLTRAINYIHLKTYNDIIDVYKINNAYDYSFYIHGYSYRIYGFKYNDFFVHKYENYDLLYKDIIHWTKQQKIINLI